MEFYILIFVLFLVFMTHDVHVQAMSIDEIFSKVEDDYQKKLENTFMPRSIRPEWDDYSLPNRSESFVKIQHDMIITKEMYREIINRTEKLPQHRRKKRNATNKKIRLWSTKRISYKISDEFNKEHKLAILEAMNHLEEYTCLKFVEAKVTDIDGIEFKRKDGVCESFVGRMGGFQAIGLDLGCMSKRILVHEILHAIGFHHEQMRADRDQYVFVNYTNIDKTKHKNFYPLNEDQYQDFNKPYDYYSVMHYGKLSFSIDRDAGLVTIKPRNLTFLDIIGNSPSLSYYDMKIANDLYKCSAGCPGNTCVGGFVGGSNCECFCQYDNEFDVRICRQQACSASEIIQYDVFDEKKYPLKVTTDKIFAHGTHLYLYYPLDQNCGNRGASYTCENGQWKGELLPCIPVDQSVQKACPMVGNAAITGSAENWFKIECITRLALSTDDQVPDLFHCNREGQWQPFTPICEPIQKVCPMVVNAAITGSAENGFKVECSPRHSLVTDGHVPDLFYCNKDGQWQPFTPICEPKNCTVPTDKVVGSITNTNGVSLNPGNIVAHGTEVNLRCPRRYVQVYESYKCLYGAYDTPDGNIPNCMPVTCGQPPVVNTGYSPRKSKYMIGEEIRPSSCRGKTYLKGDKSLTCTQYGTWSGRAECVTFCPSNTDGYEKHKNAIIPKDKKRSYSTKVITHSYCQDLCTNSWKDRKGRRQLCGGYVFGYNGKYYECTLHYQRPEDLIAHKEYEQFMTLGIRICL